jgi:uncharacterized damage-inducible protein DinB
MDKEQAITLVEYNIWANHKVIVKAAHLTEDELHVDASLSHHSIMETLLHILDTQWYWREGAQTGKLPTKPLAVSDFPNFSSLRQRWEQEDRILLSFV